MIHFVILNDLIFCTHNISRPLVYIYVVSTINLLDSNSRLIMVCDKSKEKNGCRERSGEALFIDDRDLGQMETRTLKVLSDEGISKVAKTSHGLKNRTKQ